MTSPFFDSSPRPVLFFSQGGARYSFGFTTTTSLSPSLRFYKPHLTNNLFLSNPDHHQHPLNMVSVLTQILSDLGGSEAALADCFPRSLASRNQQFVEVTPSSWVCYVSSPSSRDLSRLGWVSRLTFFRDSVSPRCDGWWLMNGAVTEYNK